MLTATKTKLHKINVISAQIHYPKLNFNDDPRPAKLDVIDDAGIVSDRCKLLFNCVESSNVALR